MGDGGAVENGGDALDDAGLDEAPVGDQEKLLSLPHELRKPGDHAPPDGEPGGRVKGVGGRVGHRRRVWNPLRSAETEQ